MISAHRDKVLELSNRHYEPHRIRKELNLSRGTVAGILWRQRNPWPKTGNPPGRPKIYVKQLAVCLDKDLYAKIQELGKEMDMNRSEIFRMLIAFGLESLDGE